MKSVLFICTGNYYRSRFAEEVFNYHAQSSDLRWLSISAGLKVRETRRGNPGTISPFALWGLKEINIRPQALNKEPLQLTESHLHESDLTIALSRTEHQQMVSELFPDYLDMIEFWDVEDVGYQSPDFALGNLHRNTLDLINQLKTAKE